MAFRLVSSTFVAGAWISGELHARNPVLNPAEAEVRISCLTRAGAPPLEIRGKLMGPHCPYSTTVEVAYPLRPLPAHLTQPGILAARVLIPEPSLWEPTCPFLYEGPVEIVRSSERIFAGQLNHGLRTLQLTPAGLRWNGQPLVIRGTGRDRLGEADATQLRQEGYNALLASPGEGPAADLFENADRLGFLTLGRLPTNPDTWESHGGLAEHVSCLGWLLPQEVVEQEELRSAALARLGGRGPLVGAELTRPVPDDQLTGIAFVCCRAELMPDLAQVRRPRLVLTARDFPAAPEAPDILGWIRL